jgi:hypothetical protein
MGPSSPSLECERKLCPHNWPEEQLRQISSQVFNFQQRLSYLSASCLELYTNGIFLCTLSNRTLKLDKHILDVLTLSTSEGRVTRLDQLFFFFLGNYLISLLRKLTPEISKISKISRNYTRKKIIPKEFPISLSKNGEISPEVLRKFNLIFKKLDFRHEEMICNFLGV